MIKLFNMTEIRTLHGYHARYAEILAGFQADGTRAACMRAWEAVECELFTEFGERRYKNYVSFRNMAHRIRKQKVYKMQARSIL